VRSIGNTARPASRWRALAIISIIAILGTLPAAQVLGKERDGTYEILTLSPEMERFVDSRVVGKDDPNGVLKSLIDAVFGPSGLAIEYGNTRTKTPVEVFETRSGNCLSFTMLFVTMARYLGMEARFNEVAEILTWDRRGEFVVNNRHMFAEVEIENSRLRVDFLPGERKRYHLVQRISDRRALAHYYNNLGAEAVEANSLDEALAYFAEALRMDESLSLAWVNQGVALRRSGDLVGAEASYRRALEVDPSETTAATNLAALLELLGRSGEAEHFRRIVKAHQQRNPIYHYRLGLEKATLGDLQEAAQHLRVAIRRDSEDPEFHAALSAIYTRLDRSRKADQSLKRALALCASDAERDSIRLRLEELLARL